MVGILIGIDDTAQITDVRVQGVGGVGHRLDVSVAQTVPAGEGVAGLGEALAAYALGGSLGAVAGVHQGGVHIVVSEAAGIGKDGIHL